MPAGRPGHPVFARFWAWMSPGLERGGVADYRRRLLAGLAGRVIEIGAGNGLNFAYYPLDVCEVLAVEPEGHLRNIAQQNAARDSCTCRGRCRRGGPPAGQRRER